MIACLKGELYFKSPENVIIMAGGVGYDIRVTESCYMGLPEKGQEAFVSIYTYVREDTLALYGFVNTDEKETFLLLMSVSGIGPKVALAILSGISPHELSTAIRTEDFHRLTKLPGIGKKTAERLCLELKDKMPFMAVDINTPLKQFEKASDNQQVADTVSALVNLGITRANAEDAVQRVIRETPDVSFEELVRQALRIVA
ncbi:MAG: Holliday junction branch migration protein RuvA [Deltaproteobacteria bacterium]|nr:Holliday junction branch migration protein RuvA [Deltaproteobacteria bacterium]